MKLKEIDWVRLLALAWVIFIVVSFCVLGIMAMGWKFVYIPILVLALIITLLAIAVLE